MEMSKIDVKWENFKSKTYTFTCIMPFKGIVFCPLRALYCVL